MFITSVFSLGNLKWIHTKVIEVVIMVEGREHNGWRTGVEIRHFHMYIFILFIC